MKRTIYNLIMRIIKNESRESIFTSSKPKMARPLQPVPFYWALIPLEIEKAMNKNFLTTNMRNK